MSLVQRPERPRILVVEDEMIVARDLEQQLLLQGYTPVGHCTRGEEAIELAGRLRPHLVLMDIQLAGRIDGIAAAQEIRSRHGLPVVFLTAFAADDTIARAKLTEPFGYILKPFSERELRTVLEMALYKHAAELRLRETELEARHRLHCILDDVAAYSIAFDAGGCMVHVSAGLLARSGYAAGQLQGQPLALLVGAEPAAAVLAELAQGQPGRTTVQQLRTHDGSWWPVHLVLATGNGSDPRFLLVGRDREAEVAAEARLEWLRRLIRNAQELLRSESAARQRLELAFLDIAEREQARIGQELHDNVGQQLAGIAFLGQALQQRLAAAGREEAQDAGWIAQLLAQTLDSLRAISRDLSPGGMESGNLEESLHGLCARSERLHGVACRCVVEAPDGAVAALAPVLSLNLFRIAQEALNNALRHGRPELVAIALRLRRGRGSLSVRNDGPGFDTSQARDGMGLRNMRIRARALDGRSRLRSGSSGTLLLVRFPLSTGIAATPPVAERHS